MLVAVLEAVVVSSSLFAGRHVFGYVFSNDKEVVDYVTNMAPLICLAVILNSIHGVLSGLILFLDAISKSITWIISIMSLISLLPNKVLLGDVGGKT